MIRWHTNNKCLSLRYQRLGDQGSMPCQAMCTCPVMYDSLQPHGLQPIRLLSLKFSKQEYWSGLPFPTSGHLPNPWIKLVSLASHALAGKFFTTVPPGKPNQGSRLSKIENFSYCWGTLASRGQTLEVSPNSRFKWDWESN